MRRAPKYDDILTPREWEVLELLRLDLTNEEIAEKLGISFGTAKYHVGEILSKLDVESREEAAAWRPEAGRRWAMFSPLTSLFGLDKSVSGLLGGKMLIGAALQLLAVGITAAGYAYLSLNAGA